MYHPFSHNQIMKNRNSLYEALVHTCDARGSFVLSVLEAVLDSAWALGRFGTTPSTGEETGFAWPP